MYDLYDHDYHAHARTTDPETSHAAAAAKDVMSINDVILEYLAKAGKKGGTTIEISEDTGIDRVSVSPQLRPLTRLGRVMDSGLRRRRNNRDSIVWVLAA